MRSICVILSVVICVTSADLLEFLKPTVPEKFVPVEILKIEGDVLTKPLAVVFVTNASSDPQADALAQLTSARSVPPAIFLAPSGILKDLPEGTIAVFRAGQKTLYHGIYDAATLLKYLVSLEETGLKTITNKLDKIAFDHKKGTKLVGYFAPASNELAAFEQAAALFGVQVSFFVVTDPVVAKHLKLNATGQVHLVREFDRTPIPCPVNPAGLVDIQQLIVRNRAIVKVTPMNVRSPSFTKSPSVLLLTDSSPLSLHLLKLVSHSYRGVTQIQARVLWIEINDFPTIDLTSQALHGLTKLPGLGCWNPAGDSGQWLDLATLNAAPSDRVQEEANMLLIKAFITSRCSAVPAATNAAPVLSESLKTEL